MPAAMNKLFAQVTRPSARVLPGRALARLFVRDMELLAVVGIYDHEKTVPQRIRVSLDLHVLDRVGPKRDEIADVVSYEEAVEIVRGIVGAGHVNLLETLAERIAAALLADVRIRAVTVRIEKLDAFAEAASVGIEITRGQP